MLKTNLFKRTKSSCVHTNGISTMEKNEKKLKKPRLNPTHRWSESETRDFVEAVLDQVKGNAESFESEERGTPSRRSKSEGPSIIPNGRTYPISTEHDGTTSKQAGESNGLLKKTISKLTTEYRLQFVWPNVRRIKGQTPNDTANHRKSISMGALRSNQQQNNHHHQTMPTVHKKRRANKNEATLHELEPLVNDGEDRKVQEKQVTIVERKITVRPFSSTFDQERINHFITKKENFGFDENIHDVVDNKQQGVVIMNGRSPPHSQPNLDLWFKEVVELRRKAGEYKCRGWGMEIDPDLFKKQKELWEQVSKRSSLSALSLDSSVHRPYTKEEKEQENNKKSLPTSKTQKSSRVPGQAYLIDNKDDLIALPARFNHIRHHLERTTGPDMEEGALLPSPTREKLMPAITKRESESQRGSPKKTAASRHGSPQKGSPQKGSPKKVAKTRSQSVGPGIIESVSPKRQIRSASTAPFAKSTLSSKKTPTSAGTAPTAIARHGTVPNAPERKPRPSTLSTTFHSRMKSSSLPPNGRTHSAPATNQLHTTNQSQSSAINKKSPQTPQMRKKDKDRKNISSLSGGVKRPRPKSTIGSGATSAGGFGDKFNGAFYGHGSSPYNNGVEQNNILIDRLAVPYRDNKLVEYDAEDGRETAISVSSCSPHPAVETHEEPLVKSPPEPTRVKSPEQIIMRSPDPVNWTVPLDTGKTFTVTQNVKDGETYSRPQSEIKASTPVEKPPPPPQSAPPELTEQVKMDAWKRSSSPNAAIGRLIPTQPIHGVGILLSARYGSKPVPGTSIRCLDDPTYTDDIVSGEAEADANISIKRSSATDVLEKARDRFDRFWGGNKEENV